MKPLLRLTDIHKRFGGVHALRGVRFELLPGEAHALIGENGAGKSTLIKIITGAIQPDSGAIEFDGQAIAHASPASARILGIAAIYQQHSLFADLSVEENIALGSESPAILRLINWRSRRRRAVELLAQLGAKIDPRSEVRSLSAAQQQLVEIAKALGAGARLLIMDEPTAPLGHAETERLFQIIADLKSRGISIIYVSHRLEELPRVAERVTVLRDGAVVETRAIAAAPRNELIRLMVGREVAAVYPTADGAPGKAILKLKDVGCRATGLHDIDLTLRRGEIVGVGGLVGAGRTSLARLLFGLDQADAGSIQLDGKPLVLSSPRDAMSHGIALVPEDRRRHGVILDFPIVQNATLAMLKRVSRLAFLLARRENNIARDFVQRLGVRAPSIATLAGALSGGNQQKVALARWLATRPRILILDEPTQGIDIGAKAEIHRLMIELAGNGMAILLISSDMPELLALSDHIAVMRDGTIVGEMDRSWATAERVLEFALPPDEKSAPAA